MLESLCVWQGRMGHETCISIRRRGLRRWQGRVLSRTASTAAATAPAACVLEPGSTLVVAGAPNEVETRRRRLEQCGSGALAASPLAQAGASAGAVLARQDDLARVPRGTRAVPAVVAMAALARLVLGRERHGVHWRWAGVEQRCVVERGRLCPAPFDEIPWLLLTPEDACSSEAHSWLRGARARHFQGVIQGDLNPLELLAVGAALACGAPGTFPPPRRNFIHRGWRAAPIASLVTLCAASTIWWVVQENRLIELEAESATLRVRVERRQWELAARSPLPAAAKDPRALPPARSHASE